MIYIELEDGICQECELPISHIARKMGNVVNAIYWAHRRDGEWTIFCAPDFQQPGGGPPTYATPYPEARQVMLV